MLGQQLFNGVLLGATFALVALGFNLVVGAMDRLNFALGETAMVSAVVGAVLMETGLPFAVAFLAAIATGGLLAVIVYVASFRYVSDRFPTASILSSLGMGLVLTAVVVKVFGSDQRSVPDVLAGVDLDLGLFRVSGAQLVIIVLAALMTVGLYVFLDRTVWGTAIRGVSDDPTMVALLGVPVQRVILLTFTLSGVLAGAAGLLTGLAYHSVSPFDGFTSTLTALMVIVLGGLGSVTGGVIAALVIGVLQTLTVAYLSATLRDLIVFVLVGIVLLVRPQGLFGRNAGVLERV
ncbi:amino acid/amide ABC transporter membrane protein 1, HAAT family [Pseudonocardia thermophila]|jgi:Branched-chain amino acid ABC-type transport system, permease components|uniref:Amino acid/amide ABC transporter membrane protein 1, HAAT family n=1 Tax=Pseudonocardia thermophila TaxID=1848 RepID=A0A1M6XK22_PSETH|nr:branched-chain amino acid ABC transporter permease [Pseudonocardia thermophila]SHL06263.1 amino acid/amide ABC transporter membrane protein 1, HAAT family [Pseudonocardia thermophila]